MLSIKAIIIKEFLQISRDKAMLFIILVIPVIQLIVLGTAMSIEIKNLPIGICDYDKTSLSRMYINSFQSNEYLIVQNETQSSRELRKLLDVGDIKLGIVIPQDFMKNLTSGKAVKIQFLIDGVDGNGANMANGYANSITMTFIKKLPGDILIQHFNPGQLSPQSVVMVEPELLFNANADPTRHYVPGIMALLITVISSLLTAFALVKEKELGTFEQLMVTPVKKMQFIIGKIIPFFILTFIEIAISLAIIRLVYGIEVKGSILLLLFGSMLYLLSSLAIGLFVSTITKTQQQALFLAWFILVFAIMMSGFLFPIENMPAFLQNLAQFNPLLYFIQILRGIIVKGASFIEMARPLLSLGILGILAISASYLSFSKKAG